MVKEFEEIAHSGGIIKFEVKTDKEGNVSYRIGFSSNRPIPLAIVAVYALPQGVPVAVIELRGMGQSSNPPPIPGCFPVFISSDSEGRFGHRCPRCKGYWRSGPWPNMCPYCATKEEKYFFLSESQMKYVEHYCQVLKNSLDTIENGVVTINMDEVADAVGSVTKPDFYVSEESQQSKFLCSACGEFNDIIGRFSYCSLCGTRNDLHVFEKETEPGIRQRLNASATTPEACLRDAVAAFDSFIAQFAKQLAARVPLSKRRRDRLQKNTFHNLDDVRKSFQEWFDIDPCLKISDYELSFLKLKFCRRHVYEHNSGEVDERYLRESDDTTVRLKQHIHESLDDVHKLLNLLTKMVRNVHAAFHELFPPLSGLIEEHKKNAAKE